MRWKIASLSVIVTVVVSVPNLSAQWRQASGPPEFHAGLGCFASSDSKLFAAGENTAVFFSADHGVNWSPVDSQFTNVGINALRVAGGNLYVASFFGVLVSTDEGASWHRSNDGLPQFFVPFYDVAVCGPKVFAATGGAGVFLSTNGGTSWNPVDSGLTENYVFSLSVSGTNVLAGTHNGIFLSTDGGTTWVASDSGLTYPFINLIVTSGAASLAGTSNNKVFFSTDGGRLWTGGDSIPAPSHGISAFAVSGSNIFAGIYGDGVFLSTDQGTNWTPVNQGLGENMYISDLIVSGENLFAIANGAVYRRPLSQMITSVAVAGDETPTRCILGQNYPNPFNPKTVIRSQLPVASEVKLVIYDLLGREVAMLVNEKRAAGHYQDTFDASGLASGVYYYQLTAGNFVQTRNMVVLK